MTNDFKDKNSNKSFAPRLSKEEYREKKKQELQNAYGVIDTEISEMMSNPDKFRDYLDNQSRLDRYSATNVVLVCSQCPQATQLKNFEDWDKSNVRINKGAKSISMLEPVDYTKSDGTTGIAYSVKKVFDISQTNARRNPAPSANGNPQAVFRTMLKASPVEIDVVDELDLPGSVAYYDNDKQTIFVKKEVGDSTLLAQSLARELAHAQISIDSDDSYSCKNVQFQAVCIGYMLCKKYGVDTKEFAVENIPKGFANKEPKKIRSELTKMRNAMSSINNRVYDELNRAKQERSKGHER